MTKKTNQISKTNAARILDDLSIAYELLSISVDENDLSAETAATLLGYPENLVYKTLLLRGNNGLLEALIPAGRELNLKILADVSQNKKVSMVPLKELQPLTGYVRGGCSPLGGHKDYPVFIFEEILNHDKIIVNAGKRGLMFLLNPTDLIKATKAVLANIAI
jgi:Cys-tRNA(Pro)/Cys-tRNA(Cys) deacylase